MPKDRTDEYIFFGLLVIPIIWLALLIAPHISDGIIYAIPGLTESLNHPFDITWCDYSLNTIIICLLIYALCLDIYFSDQKNYRRKEEYGSAKWGNTRKLNKRFSEKEFANNKLFSQNFRLGLDGKKHRKNLHSIVIGGSSAGKTRFYCKPNIMQCNSSFVVLDPKGEMLHDLGHLLESNGYVIKVVDLVDMGKSHSYNPFKYIKNDKDILLLITNLIRNTTPKDSTSNDPFWEKSETALLQAIFLYLYHEAPEEEQNFGMVMEMLEAAEIKEDDEDYVSPLDALFEKLYTIDPESLAYKQYHIYKQATGKTAKSILVSVGVRLATFNLLKGITTYDELELDLMGERKQALFCVIPDNDSTFNFLIGMLYTQLFQTLYYKADKIYQGALKVPVHFVMDEFANIALPDEFGKLLATMRSRMIYVSIVIQNLNQLKGIFKDSWESILGLCDTVYYLGGNEKSTHTFISEYLGKETIDTVTYSKSSGSHGSYSTNYQQAGRELMSPAEVRLLESDYSVLFINGARPIFDKKFDLLKHPNIDLTYDGKAPAYEHGIDAHSIKDWQNIMLYDDDYEILSEEDMDDYFRKLDEQKKLEEFINETRKKTN